MRPMSAVPPPVAPTERVLSIDVLRGFALLGILVMNIQTFAMIEIAYFNPNAHGDFTGVHAAVWLLSRLFADQKFMPIFSLLFGAGIVLMAERAEACGAGAAGVHYRRMFWLIVFGLLHAHLLWYGDILYAYGMCGLVVFLFRRLSPGVQIALGVMSLAVCSAIWLVFGLSIPFWPPEQLQEFADIWQPGSAQVEAELSAYRGGWLEQMTRRVPASIEFQTGVFLIWTSWRAGGLMLAGMGLYRLGVFSALRSSRFYAGLVAVGVLVGLPIVLFGVYTDYRVGWDERWTLFLGWQFNHWGSVPVSLGWIGLVMLACKKGAAAWLTPPLAAVGRTALSNYLLQTLICTTLFYGHGLALIGRVERLGQILIVFAIWIVQLAISPWWLRHFRFGPAEWLWRSLTYMRPQPFRR
jgi:uncharacterized protein